MRFVPISPNYYDDLATRFDLEPSFAQRVREGGILFDRTPDGDYLHLYTEPFDGRFFFEIVQRIGRYDAYGALNAPARTILRCRSAWPSRSSRRRRLSRRARRWCTCTCATTTSPPPRSPNASRRCWRASASTVPA